MASQWPSSLWHESEYERVQRSAQGRQGHPSAYAPVGRSSTLSSSLVGELRRVMRGPGASGDPLEVLAACLRLGERALLLLAHDRLVWPMTVFPDRRLLHLRRDLAAEPAEQLADLRLLAVEPPAVRPPGDWRADLVDDLAHYRPLEPTLWRLALSGPRRELLDAIDGQASYRVVARGEAAPALPGAWGPALRALAQQASSLHELARQPGMSPERAARLLNGLYLNGRLMVLRTTPGGPAAKTSWRWWRR